MEPVVLEYPESIWVAIEHCDERSDQMAISGEVRIMTGTDLLMDEKSTDDPLGHPEMTPSRLGIDDLWGIPR